jgi:hypothetical protein
MAIVCAIDDFLQHAVSWAAGRPDVVEEEIIEEGP